MAKILTNRDDIRQWAIARGGNPVLMEVPAGSSSRTILQITFGQDALNAAGNQGPDRVGGFQLVSWEEWFSALDENGLALRVSDDPSGGNEIEYEFVAREEAERRTTEAAQKPAAVTVQPPGRPLPDE